MSSAVFRFMPKVRRFGPYVLMELLLPGGTLLALLLWISQGITRGGLLGIYHPIVTPSKVERVIPAFPLEAPTAGTRT